jgi:hypothetical protein
MRDFLKINPVMGTENDTVPFSRSIPELNDSVFAVISSSGALEKKDTVPELFINLVCEKSVPEPNTSRQTRENKGLNFILC